MSSAYSSGEHLNDRHTGAGSRGATANIFPPTLKTRSLPHCTCSAACGSERQCRLSHSMFAMFVRIIQHGEIGASFASSSTSEPVAGEAEDDFKREVGDRQDT